MDSWPPATTTSASPSLQQPDALDDGRQPGEAHLVNRDGGGAERYSCRHGALARRVLARTGGQYLAHDDGVNGRRIDPGASEGRGDGGGTKLHSARAASWPISFPCGVRAAPTMTMSWPLIWRLPG